MAKKVSNNILDNGLNYLKTNATEQHLCAGEPADFADVAARSLGVVAIDDADVTLADGDTNGRKATVAQQTGVPITGDGDVDHVAITDGVSELLQVTTCPTQTVATGNEATINAYDEEIADPT